MVQLQIVGGGKMGEALLAGLLADGVVAVRDVHLVEKVEGRRAHLRATFPGISVGEDPVEAAGTVLAVKPADAPAVAAAVAAAEGGRILSIAAGVTVAALEAACGPGVPVVRAMPNTPALVGQGASAISAGSAAGPDDVDWAAEILGAVGLVVRVPEHLLDAVTGLSGSGPAYVFLVAEAMVEAGVLAGLPRDIADALTRQTLLGAATLLSTSDDHAPSLRADVTSPGGTTAAGLRELERAGVRSAFLEAVAAAAARSRALGVG